MSKHIVANDPRNRVGEAEVMTEHIEVDGRMRTFTVVGPRRQGQALILVFHGSRQSGEIHRAFTGGAYDALTDEGALVAYLDGYRGNWNDARRESRFPARLARIDDVAFTRAVIARLGETHGIDENRVYAIGYSNGGQMVMRLLHEEASPLAGGAVVAATLPEPDSFLLPQDMPAPHPVPVLLVHGTADPVVPYAGGRMRRWAQLVFRVGGSSLSAPDTAAYFARRNGITSPPTSRADAATHPDGTRVERADWQEAGHPSVTFVTVHGGGHTVPGPKPGPRLIGRTATSISVANLAAETFGLGG
ncbi:polyhydroxybutyrate depolymerase [Microbacterium sp. SORGH_AS428]|nr:polyhydroxybutyrate depolymerase [Microbacterium sp. SORGH_AS_0428]